MKFRLLKNFILVIAFIFIIKSCIEPYEIESISSSDILTVEGRLTNETKQHQILLSRTFSINETTINPEKNATVYIIDQNGNSYNFSETEDGTYISDAVFSAQINTEYTLKIETSNGKKISSTPQKFTAIASIDNLSVEKETNTNNEEVVNIKTNSLSTSDDAKYYYFEYDETFKIIAPKWSSITLDTTNSFGITKVLRVGQEDRVCYKTIHSFGTRNQIETASLVENKIENFTVRSISTNDYILTHRYSILVKQYLQNSNAYSYYTTLNSFADSGNIFSENQIGFIEGNISNENNVDEKIIGFFEVNSVTEKRLFFNREDVLETIPDFISPCDEILVLNGEQVNTSTGLISHYLYLLRNDWIFHREDGFPATSTYLVKKVCGDCTVLGTNEQPDFWID